MDQFELLAHSMGAKMVAGIDEVGRGPLAGPVIAAAVILPQGYKNTEIRDSKKLADSKRRLLYDLIYEEALAVGVGTVEAVVIDRINILQATFLAMQEALADLALPPDFILVDGNQHLPVSIPQKTIVGGDNLSLSIAAASIIAKVSRDRVMEMYHRQFPHYNFLKNKGYGTAQHLSALRQYGPCKIHRQSFRWDKKNVQNAEFDFGDCHGA
ncbi:MAG: ribonuclease HII [Syntrophobacterales bacterium]|jgi:ribonuclease HII|nr:ribonuclease HII [Syntrophobacterales bacterium]